jgi:hypothetical protein
LFDPKIKGIRYNYKINSIEKSKKKPFDIAPKGILYILFYKCFTSLLAYLHTIKRKQELAPSFQNFEL